MASEDNWEERWLSQSSALTMREGGLLAAGFYWPLSGEPLCSGL